MMFVGYGLLGHSRFLYFLKKRKRVGEFCPETTRVKRLDNVYPKMVCLFFVVCAQMICYKILKEMQHCTAAVRKLPGLTCGDTNRINMEHTVDTINLLIFTPVHLPGSAYLNLSQEVFSAVLIK